MNIHIDSFDTSLLQPNVLDMMNYLHKYLDEQWCINKKNHSYILKKQNNKLVLCDGLYIKNKFNISDENPSQKYILCFLDNVLNNGWTIKKQENNYIFIKNHEGKKEIFSNNYINTFIKENFNFNLIK